MTTLFCFGLGYSAKVLSARLKDQGWQVMGTSRTQASCDDLNDMGFEAFLYEGKGATPEISQAIKKSTHLLQSISPPEAGDPVLQDFKNDIIGAKTLKWCGYLSTVGVYGDHQGNWIDEETKPKPTLERGKRRVKAENAWLDLCRTADLPVHIFRLSGIYGPGRSPIHNLKTGRARRIVKPGQVFNRIHVEDIANALLASMQRPNPGAIYNVTDDEPAPPQDVVTYAAEILGVEPPPFVPFEKADLSPMGRSFYGENKRVSNAKIKKELGMEFAYPTYRQGVSALAKLSQLKKI